MIFVVAEGSLSLSYTWKRTITLRELSVGSLFSTYLGRYFRDRSPKTQHLEFVCRPKERSLLLGFPVDIFYE
jgi:hypothetical protein